MSVEPQGASSAYSDPTVRKALAELAVKVSQQMDDPQERAKLPSWVREIASSSTAVAPVSNPDEAAPAEANQKVVVEGLLDNSEVIYDANIVQAIPLKRARPNHRRQATKTGRKQTYEIVVFPETKFNVGTGARWNPKTGTFRMEVSGFAFEAPENFELVEIERLIAGD